MGNLVALNIEAQVIAILHDSPLAGTAAASAP
jgi:hypothetical protein